MVADEVSGLDTITAPIRQVRVANFPSLPPCVTGAGEAVVEDDDGAHALDGAATAAVGAGLRADEASGLDTITAPIRQVRVADLSPDCCGVGEGAGDEITEAEGVVESEASDVAAGACLAGAPLLDNIAAPTRQVRTDSLSEECWGAIDDDCAGA